MTIEQAQQDARDAYLSGVIGQLVTGLIWLLSAAAATWLSPEHGVATLIFGGMFIYLLTTAVLKLMGLRGQLASDNPLKRFFQLNIAAMAMTYPLVIFILELDGMLFYPAFMIIVGAHYLAFVTLYGVWQYLILAGLLGGGGVLIALSPLAIFPLGGWLTGIVLLLFSAVLYLQVGRSPQAQAATI